MDLGKEITRPPTSTPVGRWMHPRLKKLIQHQNFRLPWLSTSEHPTSVEPAPQFRYTAPIESKVNVSDVISQVVSEKVCLSVEELLDLAPEVRRHFKEATTMKRLPALQWRQHSKVAHHIATFSMDKHHEHFLAEPALPLQMIEITLDHMVTVNRHYQQWLPGHDYLQRHWERLGC